MNFTSNAAMLKSFIVLAAAFMLAVGAGSLLAQQETGAVVEVTATAVQNTAAENETVGHLTVDREVLDMGTLEPGQRISGNFTLTNDGNGPLEFDGQPGHSCGCTVPHLDTMILQPGQSTTLTIVYTAGTNPGMVSKKLWVMVKPPAGPRRLEMHIQADIRRLVETEPQRFELQVRDVPSNNVPLVLRSMNGTPFRITGFTSTGQALSIDFDPEQYAAEHQLPINVDLAKLRDVPMGSLTVNTDYTGAETVIVPFQVTMPFTAAPPRKFFRDIQPGRPESAEISVISNYGAEFQLGEMTSENGLIEVQNITSTEGGYIIHLTFTPPMGTTTRLTRDTLTVEIADHPEDTIEILFYGRAHRNGDIENNDEE